MQDLATQWIQAYPCKTQASQEAMRCLRMFLDSKASPKVIYSDNSRIFGKACEDQWNRCTCTPHRSETNGIAERAVRSVKEGTSAILLYSGLDGNWWDDPKECCCFLRNVQDLLSEGKTRYDRRFGEPFCGPVIPCGSMVDDHPISAEDQARLHQFGKKVLRGIFVGCALCAGGIRKRDILVSDVDELKILDASEIHA